MALVLRTVVGRPLTWQEGDDNLLYLSQSIVNTTGIPGGVDGEIQYNDNGTFAGVSDLTYSNGELQAIGSFTGSFTGSLVGTLDGTASFALNGQVGGVDGQVQYNDNGILNGIANLTYNNGLLQATGSFQGNLDGTAVSASRAVSAATADFVTLTGLGINVNGLELTASVRTVNGSFPDPSTGNVSVALTATVLGTSASFDASGSGDVTGSLQDGLVWIIANDPTTAWNGDVYIYSSGSVGAWYPVAPLDQAAGDARYLMLNGFNGPMNGDLDMGANDITNANVVYASEFQGDLTGTATTASYTVTAQTASYLNPLSQNITAVLKRPDGFVKLSGGDAYVEDPATHIQTSYGNSFILNNLKYESNGVSGPGFYRTTPGNGGQGKPGSVLTLEPAVGQLIFSTAPRGASGSLATTTERFRVASTEVVIGGGGATNLVVTGSTILSGSSLRIDLASKANGYVLTSDASGNATWQVPAGGGIFPYTGSARITGSLGITGSLVVPAGPNVTTKPDRVGAAFANFANIYPQPDTSNLLANWNKVEDNGIGVNYLQSQFPSLHPYFNGGGGNTSGGNSFSYILGNLGIGNNTYDPNYFGSTALEAIYLHTTQTAGPNASTGVSAKGVVRTIISDNNTLDPGTYAYNINPLITANGRTHVLSVTGSMLARDGVTLGTNLSNKHYITGSVAMTGSLTVNGSTVFNLNTMIQAANDTQAAAAGVPIGGVYRSGNFLLIRIV